MLGWHDLETSSRPVAKFTLFWMPLASLRSRLISMPVQQPHAYRKGTSQRRSFIEWLSSVGSVLRFEINSSRHSNSRISKCGDAMLRMYLFEAAGVLLTRVPKWSAVRAWG